MIIKKHFERNKPFLPTLKTFTESVISQFCFSCRKFILRYKQRPCLPGLKPVGNLILSCDGQMSCEELLVTCMNFSVCAGRCGPCLRLILTAVLPPSARLPHRPDSDGGARLSAEISRHLQSACLHHTDNMSSHDSPDTFHSQKYFCSLQFFSIFPIHILTES